jgi:hypothetical protein
MLLAPRPRRSLTRPDRVLELVFDDDSLFSKGVSRESESHKKS